MANHMTTRFFTQRLKGFEATATNILMKDAQQEYQRAADDAAEYWSGRIPSGRGGSWNSQMKDVTGSVTMPKAGGFFVRVGWLNNPPQAKDEKTSWFVYHDTGYRMYGGSHWVAGLMIQQDARARLVENLRDANDRIAAKVEAAARRL